GKRGNRGEAPDGAGGGSGSVLLVDAPVIGGVPGQRAGAVRGGGLVDDERRRIGGAEAHVVRGRVRAGRPRKRRRDADAGGAVGRVRRAGRTRQGQRSEAPNGARRRAGAVLLVDSPVVGRSRRQRPR